jgi:hypothetical protein
VRGFPPDIHDRCTRVFLRGEVFFVRANSDDTGLMRAAVGGRFIARIVRGVRTS